MLIENAKGTLTKRNVQYAKPFDRDCASVRPQMKEFVLMYRLFVLVVSFSGRNLQLIKKKLIVILLLHNNVVKVDIEG